MENKHTMGIMLLSLVLSLIWTGSNGQVVQGELPHDVIECLQGISNGTSDGLTFTSREETHIQCLETFLWKFHDIHWSGFNITEDDKRYINSLIGSMVHRGRQKRHVGPGGQPLFPKTGFRIRREYRRLSDKERFAFHAAVNILKKNGRYDVFANVHQGVVVTSAHDGPNFLGWHRVYLALYEEAIRMVNPRLSLPYWDSTLDFHMDDPVRSIIWSTAFFGNGDGLVTRGPFASWKTPVGPLTRNIGTGSQLISGPVVRKILTRCRMKEITFPTAVPDFNLELAHGGPHLWVGGQMSGLNTAGHDPVFFLHHAYVDYIWELFRIRQAKFCGVNPPKDYPPTMGEHASMRPMDGLPGFRNTDGIRAYWTKFWYRYESSPTCSKMRPFCGTPYLRCDVRQRRCVSVPSKEAPVPMGGAISGFVAATMYARSPNAARARAQAYAIRVGPVFRHPPAEPRTQDAQIAFAAMGGMAGNGGGRFRRQVNQTQEAMVNARNKNAGTAVSSLNFGPTFMAPPDDHRVAAGRDNEINRRMMGSAKFGETPDISGFEGHAFFTRTESMPLLPVPDYQGSDMTNNKMKLSDQNNIILNSQSQNVNWAYIPVKVTYNNDVTSSSQDALRKASSGQSFAAERSNCPQDSSATVRVNVESTGLNYYGTYTDSVRLDRHLPFDSAVTFIGIKSPDSAVSSVILSASHSCGIMCRPSCFGPDRNPMTNSFKPCTGVLIISAKDRHVYGRTYEEAVSMVQQGKQVPNGAQRENVNIIFSCSNVDMSPWLITNGTIY